MVVPISNASSAANYSPLQQKKTASPHEPPDELTNQPDYASLTPEQRLQVTEPLVLDLSTAISAYLVLDPAAPIPSSEEGQLFSLFNSIDQSKKELNRLIVEGWDPLDNTDALSPGQQANLVGLLMGIYLNSEDPTTRFSAFFGLKMLILNEAYQILEISFPLKIKIISFLIDIMGRDPDPWLRQSASFALGDLLFKTDLLDWQKDQIISAFLATAENKGEDPRVRQVAVSYLEDCLYQVIPTETSSNIIDLFICISQDESQHALVRSCAALALIFLDEEQSPLEINLLAADAICEMSFNNELPSNLGYSLFGDHFSPSIRRETHDHLISDLLSSDRIRPEAKDRIVQNMVDYYQ